MHIGLMFGGLQSAPALGALAAEAEALGFDSLWAGDHIAFPAPILDPLTLLACYAARTTRVRLGTCVYLLPLRHPTPVAKMVASLDFVSEGRVIFGIGVGGEFPGEFQASGVPVRERGARTDEAIGVLRGLWRGDGGAHRGRFFDIDPVRLAPLPAQSGGPPIWVGGRSDAGVRRAARFGDGYVGYLMDAPGCAERFARVRALAADCGRGDHPITMAVMAFASIDPDRDAAIKRAGMMLGAMYARPMESAAARYCIAGDAAACRAAAQRYAEAGVEHLILTPLAYGDDVLAQVRLLAAALNDR
jgi:probable F420-dependent oxidoreductase